jgi:hypothetical protein
MVVCMASTRKVTYSLDLAAAMFAEQAAEGAGMSASAWVSRAIRHQAVREIPAEAYPADEAAAEAGRLAAEQHAATEAAMRRSA